jgi:ketosteroid isomerase-like protein
MTLGDLDPQLQRLVDKDAITRLKHEFSWAIEHNDVNRFVGLFTENARVRANPAYPLDGRDAIRARYTDVFDGWHGPFSSLHVVTNARIDVDGDDAQGTWYLLDLAPRADASGGGPIQVMGVYEEEYRRVNGGWLVSSLKLKYLWRSSHDRFASDETSGFGGESR